MWGELEKWEVVRAKDKKRNLEGERERDVSWPLESRGSLNGGCNEVFNI